MAAAEWRARPGEGDFWEAYAAHCSRKEQETAQANPRLTTVSVSEISGDMALLYICEAQNNLIIVMRPAAPFGRPSSYAHTPRVPAHIRIIIGTYHYFDWPLFDADRGAPTAAKVNLKGLAVVGKELNTSDTGDQGPAGSIQDAPQAFQSFFSR